jgi:type IX secretion system PorP/SprF family membrane protein
MAFLKASAQYDPSFSNYWAMEPSFNPAAIGKTDKVNIAVAYNMSLVGFENNPKTIYASVDMPFSFLGARHGVGARLINDQIGLFSHNSVALQYAYKQKLMGGLLGIGLQGALLGENFNGSKVETNMPNDPAFSSSEVTGSGVDLGVGLYYVHKKWYAGASVQHVLNPTIELGETNELEVSRTYYFTAGGNIRLRTPFLTIHPSVLAKTDAVGYKVDLTTRLRYAYEKKIMYVGLGYSPTNSVSVFLGGVVKGISLGYSYEAYTNGLSLGNGSHELVIGYQMDLNMFKKGRNRHQSVRIL